MATPHEPRTATSPSLLARVFVSADRRRPRAGWRLLLQAGTAFFFITCCSVPLVLVPGLVQPAALTMPVMLASSAAGAVGITAASYLARRFLDRRSFVSLGFTLDRHTVPDLAVGFLIPAVQLGLVLMLELLLSWTRWQGWAWQAASVSAVAGGLALSLVTFILVGYQEELLSRGYQLQNLVEGSGLRWALFLSSVIFALLHLANPGSGAASTIGLIAAGYFLAFGWVRTGRLWLSIGLHIGWNLFEGSVYGFQVSGLAPFALMRHFPSGPAWATGGAFGPEAGAVMLPAYAVGVLLVLAYSRNRRPRPPQALETPS
ncbi:MAG TPA: CPBP family intramembrane glutamic endopeptidase [Anaerolineales bacterium]|nr:CPBP family intramembrane glutamic endopeptidase [Anaerolineales bacterium]